MTDEGSGIGQGPERSALSRRGFLCGGTAALGLVAAACSEESTPESTSPPGEDEDQLPGADLTLATTALTMEGLVVGIYDTAVQAMEEGRLGDVPAALGELVTTVRAHHVEHRDAWVELVGSAETPTRTPALEPMERKLTRQASELSASADLARLTVDVEEIVSDTYFLVLPSLSTADVLQLVATIQPVDSQHAAIARFMLGEYPVPETFSTGERAFART